MNKLIKPAVLFAVAALAALLTAASISVSAATEQAADPAQHVSDELYTLRACNGIVCVFSGDGSDMSDPLVVTGIGLQDMREIDRDMFHRGVSVGSWNDVVRLLEDFSA